MKRRAPWIYMSAAAIVYIIGFQSPAVAQSCNNQPCPPCYNNGIDLSTYTPPSGRTAINVYINSSWDVSPGVTNSHIYNGVDAAVTRWSNATTTQCASRTDTPFYLQLNQGAGEAAAQIIVRRQVPQRSDCAELEAEPSIMAIDQPFYINLDPKLGDLPDENVAGVVSHELGHALGLAHTIDTSDGSCNQVNSVMRGTTSAISCTLAVQCPDIVGGYGCPSDSDVAQTINHEYDRAMCGAVAPTLRKNLPLEIFCPEAYGCSAAGFIDGDGCQWTDADRCPDDYNYTFAPSVGESCCVFIYTPIVIDLLGNGFDFTSPDQGVTFDIKGDGHPKQLAWTTATADDAWLVLDRNTNGKVDDGKELFGNFTPQPRSNEPPNGFNALSALDQPQSGGNGDGVLDDRDAAFGRLKVWVDRNHNAVSEVGELRTLEEVGVQRIDLKYHPSKWQDMYGNTFRYRGRVWTRTGVRSVIDVWLMPAPNQ